MNTFDVSGFRKTGLAAAVETKDAKTAQQTVSEIETPEIKRAFEAVLTTFEQFKASNDEALKELKTKGATDPILTERVEKTNQAVTDFKAAVDNMKAEEAKRQEQVDRLETAIRRTTLGGAGNDNQKAAMAVLEFKRTTEGRRFSVEDLNQEDFDRALDYKRAVVSFMAKNGQRDGLSEIELKALSVGVQGDGGFFVTPEMAAGFTNRIFETSQIRSVAGSITVGTDAYEIIQNSQDGISGGWVGEKTARPATGTQGVDKKRIEVFEQYAYPEATQQVLEDAAIDLEAWLQATTQDRLVRDENNACVAGNGVNKPKGFLAYGASATTADDASGSGRAWGTMQYVALGGTTGFGDNPSVAGAGDPDPLIDMVYALKSAYRQNAVWAMRRLTSATVRKVKDGDGNYIWSPGLSAGQPDRLLGYPIVEMEDMDAWASNNFPIAFGDFGAGYLIVDRRGFAVLRDPYTNKPYVGFYITKRIGGDVVNFDAIKLGKAATS